MTDYKAIFGKKIKFLTTDLSNAEGEGEIFYSDTDKGFKVAVAAAAWHSGAVLNNARTYIGGGVGPQTAALAAGGWTPPQMLSAEEYNGTGWSEQADLTGTGQFRGMAGIQTAALCIGGFGPPPNANYAKTEEYDGSAWTEGGDLNTARGSCVGSGTQTAGLAAGGNSGSDSAVSEEYDGSSWTSGNNMNTARTYLGSAQAGLQTAALIFGGNTGPGAVCESYNGTSWTEVGDLNNARSGIAGAGIQTDALAFSDGHTESFDGTSWTESAAALATSRSHLGGSGASGASALAYGGQSPTVALTEEWNITAMAVTAGAWASGGNLNTARNYIAGFGIQTSAVGVGGHTGPANSQATEEYDGSSWTNGNNLGTARFSSGGCGTLTAGLVAGGGPAGKDETEEYDGTNWSEQSDLNTSRLEISLFGVQTAAVGAGGYDGTAPTAATEEYNGSSWTAGENMGTARKSIAPGGAGTLTAGLICGGGPSSPPYTSVHTEEYDGTDWTAGGNLLTAVAGNVMTSGGTQTAAVQGKTAATTEAYNGTVWSTNPALASIHTYGGGAGTSTAGLIFGGNPSPKSNATEEFTGETTSLNLKTITDS